MSGSRPAWARSLVLAVAPHLPKSRTRAGIPSTRHAKILRAGIGALERAAIPNSKGLKGEKVLGSLAVPGQPFDEALLSLSPLYRRSRVIYRDGGGQYRAALVSSPRTLSSPILLEQTIEYTPAERELVWAATDPAQVRDASHLLSVRTYCASLFHEQSHRILWRWLPPPPRRSREGLRRYLNFVESLVIALDMALGDELGPELAATFYLAGVAYDPGTRARAGLSPRQYRNYLQAALHATYLNLELYDPADIPRLIEALFPGLGSLAARAANRACNLDRGFVVGTNPVWQERHRNAVEKSLARLGGEPLALPSDPADNRLQYLFGERWFAEFGL